MADCFTTHNLPAEELERIYERVAACLNNGGMALVPSDTVYGIAMRLDDRGPVEHVRKLFEMRSDKAMPLIWNARIENPRIQQILEHKQTPVITHLLDRWLHRGVSFVYDLPEPLWASFEDPDWVLPGVACIDHRLAFRCPAHPGLRRILASVDGPVALFLTSGLRGYVANVSTATVPVLDDDSPVDIVLDEGRLRSALPSTVIQMDASGVFRILREGPVPESEIMRSLDYEILFVCTGNTCRSPLAEAITQKLRSLEPYTGVNYASSSAGIAATPGAPATAEAIRSARGLGVDLTGHRARRLTPELIANASLVLGLTEAHAEAARAIAATPKDAAKIYRLDPASDIHDPFGGPQELYEEVADHLMRILSHRFSAYRSQFVRFGSMTQPS